MEFNIESLAACRKKISVQIPQERVQEAFDKKYEELNTAVALPGFRPGKAPRKLLERRFAEHLGPDVREDLLKDMLTSLVEDQKVEPLAPPEIDVEALELDPAKALELEFELVTKPEFETPTYKGLEVKVAPINVTDEMIDQAVDHLRQEGAKLESVEDGKIEERDVLILDWEAKDGDSVEAQDSGAYYPYPRGVVGGFVATDLDEQLEGKGVGTTATSQVEVQADDPREELRGKSLALEVTVKDIKRYILPPIDKAFLEKHDFDDVEELRDDISKKLKRHQSRLQERQAEQKLVEQLIGNVEISLPDDFVDQELEGWASRKRVELQMEQVAEEEIEKKVAEARDDARKSIEEDMREHFLLERIADEEGLEATEVDLSQAIQEIAAAYQQPIEQVAGHFRDGNRLAELRAQVLRRKAREAIRSSADLVEDASLLEDDAKGDKPKAAKKKKASKKKAAKKKSAKKD